MEQSADYSASALSVVRMVHPITYSIFDFIPHIIVVNFGNARRGRRAPSNDQGIQACGSNIKLGRLRRRLQHIAHAHGDGDAVGCRPVAHGDCYRVTRGRRLEAGNIRRGRPANLSGASSDAELARVSAAERVCQRIVVGVRRCETLPGGRSAPGVLRN